MVTKAEKKVSPFKKHVHTRLRWRIYLYIISAILLFVTVIVRIFYYGGDFLYPIVLFVGGTCIGLLFAKIYPLHWHEEAETVLFKYDLYGTSFFIFYIVFELIAEKYLKSQFVGTEIDTVVYSFICGAFIGRGVGIYRKIEHLLRYKEIIE